MGENTEQLAQRPYMSMEMASDETWEFLIMNPMACMWAYDLNVNIQYAKQ